MSTMRQNSIIWLHKHVNGLHLCCSMSNKHYVMKDIQKDNMSLRIDISTNRQVGKRLDIFIKKGLAISLMNHACSASLTLGKIAHWSWLQYVTMHCPKETQSVMCWHKSLEQPLMCYEQYSHTHTHTCLLHVSVLFQFLSGYWKKDRPF